MYKIIVKGKAMDFSKQISSMKDDMVASAIELIRIKSVQKKGPLNMPFGKEMDNALNYVLDLAEKMGFAVKKIDGYCGYAEYGEGDIYIGVFGHVDVHDENAEDWKYDPYGGIVEKNRIYGCCAVDKGALVAALFAMKAIKDAVGPIKRKVRLIIGTDERRYYTDMKSYLKSEAPPIAGITLDGHFPVTYAEKGLVMMEYRKPLAQEGGEYIEYIKGGKLDNLIPGYCSAKIITDRRSDIVTKVTEYSRENRRDVNAKLLKDGVLIEAFGREGHCASIEKGINSNAIMLDFLRYAEIGDGDVREVIDFLCEKIGFDIYGESLGIAYEDEFSGKTTVNLGIVRMEKDCFSMRMDCRFPMTCNYIHAIETIQGQFDRAGFEEVECTHWQPTYFPKNHFLINALLETYREVTGDISEPVSSNSASYAEVIPNVAAFGAHYPGEGIIWDQNDEYMDIDSLELTANIYAEAIYKLCTEV